VNIGEEADPIEVPLPIHPDDRPAEPPVPDFEPVPEPDKVPA